MSVPHATLSHATPGRVRIKIPSRKGNRLYFDHLAESLQECEGVVSLHVSPMTGSVLLRHTTTVEQMAAFADSNRLFVLTQDGGRTKPVADRVSDNLSELDDKLRQMSGGDVDLRSALFLFLMAMALVQLGRGQYLGPASTFFANGLSLLSLIGRTGREVALEVSP